jgi:hypothetical protein
MRSHIYAISTIYEQVPGYPNVLQQNPRYISHSYPAKHIFRIFTRYHISSRIFTKTLIAKTPYNLYQAIPDSALCIKQHTPQPYPTPQTHYTYLQVPRTPTTIPPPIHPESTFQHRKSSLSNSNPSPYPPSKPTNHQPSHPPHSQNPLPPFHQSPSNGSRNLITPRQNPLMRPTSHRRRAFSRKTCVIGCHMPFLVDNLRDNSSVCVEEEGWGGGYEGW